MGVHELHRHDEDEPFDPRKAALAHAATAAYLAYKPEGSPLEGVFAEAANALTNGLVYVGDQILRQNALLGVQMMDDPNAAESLAKGVSEALRGHPGNVRREVADGCTGD